MLVTCHLVRAGLSLSAWREKPQEWRDGFIAGVRASVDGAVRVVGTDGATLVEVS